MRGWLFLGSAAAVTLPALYLQLLNLQGVHVELSPLLLAAIFGLAIVAAAFLLTWGAEVAQMDISQSLALAGIALIAVLPEYAVSMVFSWKAAYAPEFVALTTANMTGANRLLVGFGWPLVFLLFWLRTRSRSIRFPPALSLEVFFLGLATLYSFTLVLKASITLWDAAILTGIFGVYVWLISKEEQEEPELMGPAASLATLTPVARRIAVGLLFLLPAAVIVASAEPFTEALLEVGSTLNINEFILVQWIAPLASEAPEILIASFLTLRGHAVAAMIALISSKVNQWTLLIGGIPLMYSLSASESASAVQLLSMPLDMAHDVVGGLVRDLRQVHEVFLTAAQSLMAVILLVRLRLTWWGALMLFLLFSTQLVLTDPVIRLVYAYAYLAISVLLIVVGPWRLRLIVGMARFVWGQIRGREVIVEALQQGNPGEDSDGS